MRRRAGHRRGRWWRLSLVAVVGIFVAYLIFVGWEGSRMLVHPPRSTWCFTPASEYGWRYEAINYHIEDDARLLAAHGDPRNCSHHGESAGSEVVTSDGVRIAGWYIPAAQEADAAGATVVIVHGHGNSKSDMLAYARVVHDRYNLVLFDLRNHGRSSGTETTLGVREQDDVRAILEWLEREKAPDRVALFGISMGGATAANVADDDPRIDALVLDSTHATLTNTIETRLQGQGYPLTVPGYWAIVVGSWLRTGVLVHAADPVNAVDDLGHRPLLVLQGGRDLQQGAENAEALVAAARQAGVVADLRICPEARHAALMDRCPGQYGRWVSDFLQGALGR